MVEMSAGMFAMEIAVIALFCAIACLIVHIERSRDARARLAEISNRLDEFSLRLERIVCRLDKLEKKKIGVRR